MGFFSDLFSSGFKDPKPMDNNKLIASIAGQADWLDKMARSPLETQTTKSIMESASKRREYIADLCIEVISRGEVGDGSHRYPGATKSINVFEETAELYNRLIEEGVLKRTAATRAVREKLYVENGVNYLAEWL